MFPTHRTVNHVRSCPVCDLACRSDFYGTVDNGQSRLYQFDIACSFPDKIANLKRNAEVEDLRSPGVVPGRSNVYPHYTTRFRKKLKERFSNLAKPHHYYLLIFTHSELP